MENLVFGAFGLLTGTLIPFLFVLAVVVFIHELGHFLVGRWCGVGVKAFSLGFGPEIIGFNDKSGTRWKLSAIPLGGYVKFAGDVNAASAPDQAGLAAMTAKERAESFHHQSVAKRAAIVAAGPIANFLLAIVIFGGSAYFNGQQILAPRAAVVQPGGAAAKAGFQDGDLILTIDGRVIESFNDIQRAVSIRAGEELVIVVERAGREITLRPVPEMREFDTALGKQRVGLLGLQASRDPADLRKKEFGVVESVGVGMHETWFVVTRTMDYVTKLITGRESTDQLSGPIRIAQASGHVAEAGFVALLGLTGLLSVSIGLLNLFPIPLLDGGHLMYYAVEAVRGRPLSERAQEMGFRIGLAFVIMLMVVATWNDVLHLGSTFAARNS
jgi:regulator of sigma E protease